MQLRFDVTVAHSWVDVQEEACVREHQIRLTAVPGGKAGFSLSCKYFVHTTLPTHPPPAFFRALLKMLPGIRLSFSSVPCLFGFLMTNFCIAQNLLSLIGFLLIDVFIMKFLVSYLGAVKIKLTGGSELWAL